MRSAEEARKSGKLIALAIGDIHGGEVCGKEALPILAREILASPDRPLLKDVIFAIAPILNADGNERISRSNRPGQVGPEDGMGQRGKRGDSTSTGTSSNSRPPRRGPFSGSSTPGTPTSSSTPTRPTAPTIATRSHTAVHETLPATRPSSSSCEGLSSPKSAGHSRARSGLDSFDYGNFSRDSSKSTWESYPAEARYGTNYVGLRNRLSVLSEAYAYDPYKTRIEATRDFVAECLQTAAKHKDEILKLLGKARSKAEAAGRSPSADDQVAIRSRPEGKLPLATILGFDEQGPKDEHGRPTQPKDYELTPMIDFAATESVARPFAYLFPPRFTGAAETLRRHGLDVRELREEIELDLEVDQVDEVSRSPRRYEGHALTEVKVTPRSETRRIPAGTIVVRTGQPLGWLAVSLLEPRSEDGLTTWNFFDEGLAAGSDFPVLRLPQPTSMTTSPIGPLPEDRQRDLPITFEVVNARTPAGAADRPAAGRCRPPGSTEQPGSRPELADSSGSTPLPAVQSRFSTPTCWPKRSRTRLASALRTRGRSRGGGRSKWTRSTKDSCSLTPTTSTTRNSTAARPPLDEHPSARSGRVQPRRLACVVRPRTTTCTSSTWRLRRSAP